MEYELEVEPIRKFSLSCCALCQLSISNENSLEEIKQVIQDLKWEANSRESFYTPGRPRVPGGEKSCFVIISPGEDILEKNLIKLGFSCVVQSFPRRRGYPKTGELKMYFLTFSD